MNNMMAMNEFGIEVIDTGYLREKFAASHLIIEKGKAAFVDVGTTHSAERLLAALQANNLAAEDVEYILLTHIHLDHAGGAGKLMSLFPKAKLVVHPKGARHMIDPERLVAGAVAVYGAEKFNSLYGEIKGIARERVIEAGDGLILDFNGRELHFLDTPGHARHHVCIWDPASRGMFTGDTLGLAYPELQKPGKHPFLLCTTSPSAFEPDAMIDSINRVMEYAPSVLYLTHYGPVEASRKSVEELVKLVGEHKQMALTAGGDHDRLVAGIGNLFRQTYAQYLERDEPELDIAEFLVDDIELNAQGIEVWLARKKD